MRNLRHMQAWLSILWVGLVFGGWDAIHHHEWLLLVIGVPLNIYVQYRLIAPMKRHQLGLEVSISHEPSSKILLLLYVCFICFLLVLVGLDLFGLISYPAFRTAFSAGLGVALFGYGAILSKESKIAQRSR